MPRIIVTRPPQEAQSIRVSGDIARYLTTVLRLGLGDQIVLLYEGGGRQNAELSSMERGNIELALQDILPSIGQARVRITLAQGVLKGQKMDMVIQKATELGASVIVPVVTARCQVRDTRKVPRWQTIAQEAARQSLQPQAPTVMPSVEYAEFISAIKPTARGFVFWEEGGQPLDAGRIPEEGELIMVIGPEGGLTRSEVEQAQGAGLTIASLGPRILRAETASLTALSVIQYLCGGLGAR